MKVLLLAAGFGTRMGTLIPKQLLTIKDKPIIEYHLDNLNSIEEIDEILIVTNNKFFGSFKEYVEEYNSNKKITLINNNKDKNEERLGAVNDILFAAHKTDYGNGLLIIQSDEFFIDLPLQNLIRNTKNSLIVAAKKSKEEIKLRFGTIIVDNNNKVIDVEEKPEFPKTELVNAGVMYFTKEDINKIEIYAKQLIEHLKPYEHLILDRTGDYLSWLNKHSEIYVYVHPGEKWFDVGKPETLTQVRNLFKQK